MQTTDIEVPEDASVDGYGVEPAEVEQLVQTLVGELDPNEDPEAQFIHLSSTLALLQAAAGRVSVFRDDLVAEMVSESTERDVADRLGLSPTRPGQLARRSRSRAATAAATTRRAR
ncbi:MULTISPECIES: hypothetical protein [unclassified Amycolatopsis]|uniref:hypothetical protein n=1 Tax=unclassified Amycolatopsis TaxID=2618356 RepID=UPI002876EB17|nr:MULTISPECIES: hypothetical protein [unclassified Amycolatopsis]MDS0140540.1 hypothetical protein [Amycolatopsis sp. 505]MDS0149190.1 hypothetical protein [Amycolatopsis sp. CM201R]